MITAPSRSSVEMSRGSRWPLLRVMKAFVIPLLDNLESFVS